MFELNIYIFLLNMFQTLLIRGIATLHFWQFSMDARDLPKKIRILRIESSLKTFSGKKKEKSVELQQFLRSSCRLLRIETSVKTFSCYFWCPSRLERAH